MIGIIAALPREVRGLTRGRQPDPALLRHDIFLYRLASTIVACAGMGSERAALAVRAAINAGVSSTLLSTGLAGACDPALKAGSVLTAARVVDARSGEVFTSTDVHGVVLLTGAEIANVAEKRRLRESYGAAMVDMEAATVARLAQANGLSFRAIKGISDAYDFELEGLARFASPHGQFRTGAFALHTALHPQNWADAIELGRGSTRAIAALTEALLKL